MGLLRLILALSVVIAHSDSLFGCFFVGGKVAVQTFYIISGFYMSMILTDKYYGQKNSYWMFISNRLIRLYPIYWVVVLLVIFFAAYNYAKSSGNFLSALQPYSDNWSQMGAFSVFYLIFTNVFLVGQDIVMFIGLNLENGNLFFTSNVHETNPQLYTFLLIPQAWTIGVEILFYLIAPFIVRRNLFFILVLIIFSVAVRIVLFYFGLSFDPWSYRFFLSELVFFLLGNLSFKIFCKIKESNLSSKYGPYIIMFVLFFTIFYSNFHFAYKFYFYIFVIFISVPFIFNYTKQSKIDSWIGELSYPIYIIHMFLSGTLLPYFTISKTIGKGVVLCFLSITFAILLNKLIGERIEKFRRKRIQNFS